MIVKIFLALSAIAFLCTEARPWDEYNDLQYWNGTFEYKLSKLPMKAQMKKKPWSCDYWPNYLGGIAARWQTDGKGVNNFTSYKTYTKEELLNSVKNATSNKTVNIDILSAAEKYDIFNCRYDYPTVKSERLRVSPKAEYWEGICHGWAPASINYEQPNMVTVKNCDGLNITFASGDIKALLTYFLGIYASGQESTSYIGLRCFSDLKKRRQDASKPECWDANPGSFHLLLTNMIGLRGVSLVADIDQGTEVWNQPLVSYEYRIVSTSTANQTQAQKTGVAQTQNVTFSMCFAVETGPSLQSHEPEVVCNDYKYALELDAEGKITGGSYDLKPQNHTNPDLAEKYNWPDFLWKSTTPDFFGYFEKLREIYTKATIAKRFTGPVQFGHRVTFDSYHAQPVTDKIEFTSNDDASLKSWVIENPRSDQPLRLQLNSLTTGLQNECVRVFEVCNKVVQALLVVVCANSPDVGIIEIRAGCNAMVTFVCEPMAARRLGLSTRSGPGARAPGFNLAVL